MHLLPGSHDLPRIDGFDDLEPIGRGGFSTVYRATQVDLGRAVAVKVLDVAPGIDRTRLAAAFDRERRTLGALSGVDGVVEVHLTTYTDDGRPAIVMELMEMSLSTRVRERGPCGAQEAAAIGERLARALAVAHDRGVHHRDITPANVLVGATGTVALADFGLAALRGRDTAHEHGSPEHAAPECLAGDSDVDLVRADLYSLGSTIYHLVAGRPPFGSRRDPGGVDALVGRVTTSPRPDVARADVHPHLHAVIARAMAKHADDRYRSAGELAEALAEAASARHYDPDEATPSNGRRAPTPLAPEPARGLSDAGRRPDLAPLLDPDPTVSPSSPRRVPGDDLPTVVRPRRRELHGEVVASLAAEDERHRRRNRRRALVAVVAIGLLGGAGTGALLLDDDGPSPGVDAGP